MVSHIRIPAPDFDDDSNNMHELAKISAGGIVISIWWWKDMSMIIMVLPNEQWFMQPNSLIRSSLATALQADPVTMLITDVILYENTIYMAGDPAHSGVLDCEWSDFASDRLTISCTVAYTPAEIIPAPRTPVQQADYEWTQINVCLD